MLAKDIVLLILVLILSVCFVIQIVQDENKKKRENARNEKARHDLIKRENSDINLDGEEW
jgi:hypothetical protein